MHRRHILALLLTVLGLSLAPFAGRAADIDLPGTYKLISRSRLVVDTGQVEKYGEVQGFINYGADGQVLVLIVEGNRPKAESLDQMTDQQRAGLFRTMNAYG